MEEGHPKIIWMAMLSQLRKVVVLALDVRLGQAFLEFSHIGCIIYYESWRAEHAPADASQAGSSTNIG
jgi:hypothetical protein